MDVYPQSAVLNCRFRNPPRSESAIKKPQYEVHSAQTFRFGETDKSIFRSQAEKGMGVPFRLLFHVKDIYKNTMAFWRERRAITIANCGFWIEDLIHNPQSAIRDGSSPHIETKLSFSR